MSFPPRVLVLTVSDRSYLALREDVSGPLLVERVVTWGYRLLAHEILPDDASKVEAALRHWSDEQSADLILTTGGTGLSPRDQVPEATLAVAHRLVPGIPEWIRGATSGANPHAALSRGLAAIRAKTLIVNLPGSPRAVQEYLDHLERLLPHALAQVSQQPIWGPSDPHAPPSEPRASGRRDNQEKDPPAPGR